MIPRILSIAVPLFIYVTLVLLLRAIWLERRKFDRLALVAAGVGLVASFYFLDPVHRLFFDEDIYVNIAGNLARAPVAQFTLLGGPKEIAVSTYYKEPAGWPAILGLIFLATGTRENVAFIVARTLFALTIIAVYMVAKEMGAQRISAFAAALVFAATPVCFWFSASAGTDMPAALFSTIALWGLLKGNGALAGPALAMAAQSRLEMIVLVPLIWFGNRVSNKWKGITLALVSAQIIHILWVLSVAPVLAEAERVESAFAISNVAGNLRTNLAYLLNPMSFPVAATILACFHAFSGSRRMWAAILQPVALLAVYLLFYAGSFDINPRYSIQLLAPLAALAATAHRSRIVLCALALSSVVPLLRPYQPDPYIQTLAADHSFSRDFAARLNPADLVVSMEQEMFVNQGVRGMSSVLAAERPERLLAELQKDGKVYYHSGARTNVEGTQAWTADQWVKSNYELHLIDSREIRGMRIAFFELLLKDLDGEAR